MCCRFSPEDSLLFQDLHELITVTYGLPDWASYTIFGLATVLTGLFLGMVSYPIFMFVHMISVWQYLMWPCLLAGLFYLLYIISVSPYIFWVLVTIKIGKTGTLFSEYCSLQLIQRICWLSQTQIFFQTEYLRDSRLTLFFIDVVRC